MNEDVDERVESGSSLDSPPSQDWRCRRHCDYSTNVHDHSIDHEQEHLAAMIHIHRDRDARMHMHHRMHDGQDSVHESMTCHQVVTFDCGTNTASDGPNDHIPCQPLHAASLLRTDVDGSIQVDHDTAVDASTQIQIRIHTRSQSHMPSQSLSHADCVMVTAAAWTRRDGKMR